MVQGRQLSPPTALSSGATPLQDTAHFTALIGYILRFTWGVAFNPNPTPPTHTHARTRNTHQPTHTHAQVFLGSLRESEVELINDRLSQAVMETCLAMTIFQREFNVEFVAMFVALTFFKVSGYLPTGCATRAGLEDRVGGCVDCVEATPGVQRPCRARLHPAPPTNGPATGWPS